MEKRETIQEPEADVNNTVVIKKQVVILEAGRINFYRGKYHAPFLQPAKKPYTLIGRDTTLAQLQHALLTEKTPSFHTITGVPGVGKTALAIALTHTKDVLEHFTGGVLWTTLGAKANVKKALQDWVQELGLYHSDDPSDKQCDRIQGAIGNRRMLIVIDDVRHPNDLLSFQFGNPHCVHLLTTRDEKIAQEFTGNTNRLILSQLDLSNSEQLVGQFANWVIEKFPDDVKEVIQAVDGLPLALVLIGKYLQKEGKSRQSCFLVPALKRLKVLARQGRDELIKNLSKDVSV